MLLAPVNFIFPDKTPSLSTASPLETPPMLFATFGGIKAFRPTSCHVNSPDHIPSACAAEPPNTPPCSSLKAKLLMCQRPSLCSAEMRSISIPGQWGKENVPPLPANDHTSPCCRARSDVPSIDHPSPSAWRKATRPTNKSRGGAVTPGPPDCCPSPALRKTTLASVISRCSGSADGSRMRCQSTTARKPRASIRVKGKFPPAKRSCRACSTPSFQATPCKSTSAPRALASCPANWLRIQ